MDWGMKKSNEKGHNKETLGPPKLSKLMEQWKKTG